MSENDDKFKLSDSNFAEENEYKQFAALDKNLFEK